MSVATRTTTFAMAADHVARPCAGGPRLVVRRFLSEL